MFSVFFPIGMSTEILSDLCNRNWLSIFGRAKWSSYTFSRSRNHLQVENRYSKVRTSLLWATKFQLIKRLKSVFIEWFVVCFCFFVRWLHIVYDCADVGIDFQKIKKIKSRLRYLFSTHTTTYINGIHLNCKEQNISYIYGLIIVKCAVINK